ncbi:MAG TPA: NfeD family protein [Clostridiales bacterium]|jgi:membrane-bound serine protease (ClpP class)|nr:NfeD family protein [Clostridiales bacterium]HQP69922.1 NfeD family protein [Clostridiales bacterium]
MKKGLLILLFSALLFFVFAEKATLIKVEGMIDNGVSFYIERGIETAVDNNSDMIIFEINTMGGRVDSAAKIKDAILNSPIQTIAYVNKRAISAGALIALSCKKIIMADGSSMGAATVVDQEGEKQSEKAQSYFRSEIASTAEINGRNKDIARAMVDEDFFVPGLNEKGKLVTLTSNEALQYNMCDTVVHTDEQLYSYLGISSSDVSGITISAAERVVRFLTNPIIASLLMTLAFLGLIFEIKTAGWGVGGTVGIIALVLFFGSHYIIDMADYIELIVFLTGLVLLGIELVIIPGFGVTGILGILAILASFFMTLIGDNPTGNDLMNAGAAISSSFIMSLIGIFFMVKYLPGSKFLDFIIIRNQSEKAAGVSDTKFYKDLVGKTGKVTADLKLTGKIEIEGEVYQAISKTDMIPAGDTVRVEKVEGNKIIVVKNDK